MCRCGSASCALCQAKWVAPCVLTAHKTGQAVLPLVCEAAPNVSVVQDGKTLRSLLHPHLDRAWRGQKVAVASVADDLRHALLIYVRVHCTTLCVKNNCIVTHTPPLQRRLKAAGLAGIPLATIYAEKEATLELDALLADGDAIVADNSDVVFSASVVAVDAERVIVHAAVSPWLRQTARQM